MSGNYLADLLVERATKPALEPAKPAPDVAIHTPVAASELASNSVDSYPPLSVASYPDPLVASHKKDRHRAGLVQLNTRIDPALSEQIEEFSKLHRLTKQQFVELAASHFMEFVASKPQANVASELAHDDLKIWKTHDDIVIIYERVTGNRFQRRDDDVARGCNAMDRRLVEVAMLQTILNARGRRINSFRYFADEIKNISDLGIDGQMLDAILLRRREQVEKLRAVKRG